MMTKTKRRAKSGSWSNLRALSVNFKGRSRKEDLYVGEKSYSVGDGYENTDGERAFDQEPLACEGFSASAVARKTTVLNPETGISCDMTPRTRRKSFKQFIEKISAPGNAANPQPEKVYVTSKKHRTVFKPDSFYFNLYADAFEHGLFDDAEFAVWEVQERFPNDDLRLYEGIFGIEAADWPWPPALSTPPVELESVHRIVDPLKGRIVRSSDLDASTDGEDIMRSPAISRKSRTSWAINQSPPQNQSLVFVTRFPVFSKLSPGLQVKFKKMAQRRQSAPSIVTHSITRSLTQSSSFQVPSKEDDFLDSANLDSQPLELKFGSHDVDVERSSQQRLKLNFRSLDEDDQSLGLNLTNLDSDNVSFGLNLASLNAVSKPLSPKSGNPDIDSQHSSPKFARKDEVGPKLGSSDSDSQRLSLKFGSLGATLNLSQRKYVMEGRVQLTTGMQTQDRYMFLFSDLLIIAKAKSGSTFKLKYRVRACELWIASCLDDVCELPKTTDKSFVMGWPTTNCVATFSTPDLKELWLAALLKEIHREKERETPKTIILKIINRDSSNNSHMKVVPISHKDTAKDVVHLAVKQFNFENDDEYQLWVTSRKEGTAYPLIGHENPHAILVSHIRDFISSNGILPETEVTSVARYESFAQPEVRDRCQFVLRSSRQTPKFSADMTQRRLARLKPKTPAIFSWARKRSGQRNESSDSGHVSGNSVGSEGTASSPPSSSPPAMPKLFSLPLRQVCENGMLPTPVASMLDVLYRKAPHTCGIFRKSANARTTRHLKHKLDEEMNVELNDVPIHVVASLLKDFLRNIPDSVMDCALYAKWAQAIGNSNEAEKLKSVRRLLMSLDSGNRALIRRLAILFKRIASRSARNNMTSYNLSVCIAPSLLWPPGPSAQTEAPIKVTEIMQYFTDYCDDIFLGVAPKDADWPPEIDLKSDEDDYFDGDVENATSPTTGKSGELQKNKQEAADKGDVTHFSRSRVNRRQLQRRKSGPKAEATRLMSISQDSLDRILDDAALTSDPRSTIDDMLLTNGRDPFSISIDSGFATFGEIGGERNVSAEEGVLISREELKRLWSTSALRSPNGLIVEEAGESESVDAEHQEVTRSFSTSLQRQRSQPNAPKRRGGHSISIKPTVGGSRLVQAIASPMIYYDDEMTSSPFTHNPLPQNTKASDRSDERNRLATKERGSDEVARNAPKLMTSTGKSKMKFLSGVTVALEDVRPPVAYKYRPVTLSIGGNTDLNFQVSGFEASPGNDDPATASGDERFLSSHEDIFQQSSAAGTFEAPKSAPLYRKFDPMRSKDQDRNLFLTPDAEKAPNDRTSPIQKLTANLQMLPNFRQHRSLQVTEDGQPSAVTHCIKVKATRLKKGDGRCIGASLEVDPVVGSKRFVSNDLEATVGSDVLLPKEGTSTESRTLRQSGRARRNLASKLTNARFGGDDSLSYSLPSSAWKGAESDLSNVTLDVIKRLKEPSARMHETDIAQTTGTAEAVNDRPTSPQKVQIGTDSVQSTICHINCAASSDSHVPKSPVEFVLRGDTEGLSIIRKSSGLASTTRRKGELNVTISGPARASDFELFERKRDLTPPSVLRSREKSPTESVSNRTCPWDVTIPDRSLGSLVSVHRGHGDVRSAPQYLHSPRRTRFAGTEPLANAALRAGRRDTDIGKEPMFPSSPPPNEKNAKEIFPFIGFDNVNQSEESYV